MDEDMRKTLGLIECKGSAQKIERLRMIMEVVPVGIDELQKTAK